MAEANPTFNRRFVEAVFDLAYNAGHNNLLAQVDDDMGSRELFAKVLVWAAEFEKKWDPDDEDRDYIIEIDEFYEAKEAELLEVEEDCGKHEHCTGCGECLEEDQTGKCGDCQ